MLADPLWVDRGRSGTGPGRHPKERDWFAPAGTLCRVRHSHVSQMLPAALGNKIASVFKSSLGVGSDLLVNRAEGGSPSGAPPRSILPQACAKHFASSFRYQQRSCLRGMRSRRRFCLEKSNGCSSFQAAKVSIPSLQKSRLVASWSAESVAPSALIETSVGGELAKPKKKGMAAGLGRRQPRCLGKSKSLLRSLSCNVITYRIIGFMELSDFAALSDS